MGAAPDVGDDNGRLADSLGRLSRLAAGEMSLQTFLHQVATCAVAAVPGAEGAALSLKAGARSETAVFTTDLVAEIDALQYSLMQGPCVVAARDGVTVSSGGLGDDRRWPDFGPRAARLGVHSALSLPLTAFEELVGNFNFYAGPRDAFGDRSVSLAELFAVPAAVAVQNAHALADVKTLAAQLQTEVNSTQVVDETIGVLIARYQARAGDLLKRLRTNRRGQQP